MRSQYEFSLNYDAVLEHINKYYSHLLIDNTDSQKDASNKRRYKETCFVLKAFLELYSKLRGPSHASLTNKMQWFLQKAASYLWELEPTQDVIDHINKEVPEIIESTVNLSQVLKLLIELRKYAEIAQGKKIKNGPALLFLTLHAMACCLLASCASDFKPLIEALQQEKLQLQNKPIEDYLNNHGAGVAQLNASYGLVTGALALLNVFDGVNSANRMRLLPYYQLPTAEDQLKAKEFGLPPFNHGLPIFYQTTICIHYVYENWYLNKENKQFNEFMKDAIKRGYKIEEQKKKEAEEAKEKIEATVFNCDLVFASQSPTDITRLPGTSPFAYVLTPTGVWYVDRVLKRCEPISLPEEEFTKLMKTYDLQARLSNHDKTVADTLFLQSLPWTEINYLESKRNAMTQSQQTATDVTLNLNKTPKETLAEPPSVTTTIAQTQPTTIATVVPLNPSPLSFSPLTSTVSDATVARLSVDQERPLNTNAV